MSPLNKFDAAKYIEHMRIRTITYIIINEISHIHLKNFVVLLMPLVVSHCGKPFLRLICDEVSHRELFINSFRDDFQSSNVNAQPSCVFLMIQAEVKQL